MASLEQEPEPKEVKIVEVSSSFVLQRAQQLYRSTQAHEFEKRQLWERGKSFYAQLENKKTILVNADLLFGWWLCIKAMILDIDEVEGQPIGQQIWEGAGGTKRQDIPEAFQKL